MLAEIEGLLTPSVISEIEVKLKDAEFERDVYLNAFCRTMTEKTERELKKCSQQSLD